MKPATIFVAEGTDDQPTTFAAATPAPALAKAVMPVALTRIGIDTEQNDAQQTVYDLAGRMLREPVKGVNIINGKKVIR